MGDTVATKKKFTQRVADYFKGTKAEFKKIVWPTKDTIFNNTGIVILFCLIIGAIIYGLDLLFSWVLNMFIGWL